MPDLHDQEREKLSEWLRNRGKQPAIEDLVYYEGRLEAAEAALAAREEPQGVSSSDELRAALADVDPDDLSDGEKAAAREDTCAGCGMRKPNHAHECPVAIDAHLDSFGYPPSVRDTQRPDEREYRYECAHGHSWIAAPTERMKCCVCGTISLQRLKPIDNHDEMARQLWRWNVEHGGTGYPYGRLIDVTKDDLRTLARRLAPFVQPVRDTEQERER